MRGSRYVVQETSDHGGDDPGRNVSLKRHHFTLHSMRRFADCYLVSAVCRRYRGVRLVPTLAFSRRCAYLILELDHGIEAARRARAQDQAAERRARPLLPCPTSRGTIRLASRLHLGRILAAASNTRLALAASHQRAAPLPPLFKATPREPPTSSSWDPCRAPRSPSSCKRAKWPAPVRSARIGQRR